MASQERREFDKYLKFFTLKVSISGPQQAAASLTVGNRVHWPRDRVVYGYNRQAQMPLTLLAMGSPFHQNDLTWQCNLLQFSCMFLTLENYCETSEIKWLAIHCPQTFKKKWLVRLIWW